MGSSVEDKIRFSAVVFSTCHKNITELTRHLSNIVVALADPLLSEN